MPNLLEKYEEKQIERLSEGKDIPSFQAGDTVRVNVRIIEGKTERIQAFEGLCIARKNRGINSSFTVRKISHGEGVERVFPLYSPRIDSIEVVRRGVVRRAKLYYMRELTGKAARIKEKRDAIKPPAAKEPAPKNNKAKEASAKVDAKTTKESDKVKAEKAKKEETEPSAKKASDKKSSDDK